LKTLPWPSRESEKWRFFAAVSSHPRKAFPIQKIIIDKSNAYLNGKDQRLNSRIVEVYDEGVHGLITKEGERNRELINAW
jgi:hypothetical protein